MVMKILLSVWLLWMSVLDVKSCSVPKKLLWMGGCIVLAFFLVLSRWESGAEVKTMELIVAIILGAVPGFCLLAVAYITKSVGYGDGVVLVVLGIVSGAQKGVLILTMALFLAAICSVILLLLQKVQRNSSLPFLPFLAIGWFLVEMG